MNAVHDKNGNLLSFGSDSFSWNAWGQMTGASQSGVSRQYKYDASGRLSSVQTGSSSTTPKQWLGWTDLGSGDPGLGLDNPLKGLGGKWNLTDSVGSVSGQVDPSTGAISSRQSFGPFGEEAASNAGASGFSGRDRVGNGILYFRNRMYSPLLGRFLSEDPIGFSGSPDGNFFAYCGNDPVNFSDPLGLERFQFTDDPDSTFEFDKDVWREGWKTGWHNLASGFSGGLYDGGAYRCAPGAGFSRAMGGIAKAAATAAFGHYMAGTGNTPINLASGRSGFQTGNAGSDWENYVRSSTGGKQDFKDVVENGITKTREIDARTSSALISAKDVNPDIKLKNFLSKSTRAQIKSNIGMANEEGLDPVFWFKKNPNDPGIEKYITDRGGIFRHGKLPPDWKN